MLRQRVELKLGTATKLDPVTHPVGPQPDQPGITCSAGVKSAARQELGVIVLRQDTEDLNRIVRVVIVNRMCSHTAAPLH